MRESVANDAGVWYNEGKAVEHDIIEEGRVDKRDVFDVGWGYG